MLLYDCQIITDDMRLTSSHLHVAPQISSLATAPWHRAYQEPLSPPAHLESGSDGRGVGRECLQGAITALAQRAPLQPCHVESVPLRLFPLSVFLFSVRWCAHRKSPAVCIRSPNALCQLAVPAVTVEIRLSADVPSVWQRVASPSILKGLPWPRGTGSR